MTTETKGVVEQVGDLLERELGERWGDGDIVTDVISGYAEPGYGGDDAVIVLGNWNGQTRTSGWSKYSPEHAPLFAWTDRTGPMLADALEELGAEIEWLDEWTSCSECYRAVRTVENSYSWKPFYAWIGDCDIVCGNCLRKDEGFLEAGEYINEPTRCVTWADSSLLEEWGWVKWEPGDEHDYENGWCEGQNDDPKLILAEILRRDEDAKVVFLLDSTGQFDIHFSAWTKPAEED